MKHLQFALVLMVGAAAGLVGARVADGLQGEPTFRLVYEASDGNTYIEDTGLSLGDCYEEQRANGFRGFTCEREG